MSPVPTSRAATSYPTPRTQSTAEMLTALKSSATLILRNKISPESSLTTPFYCPIGTKQQYTFSAEEDKVEEKALKFLDRTGHLSQVAGSQSMLSQELLAQEDETPGPPSSQLSGISTNSPMSIARRYGILTQEVEDENASIPSVKNNKNSFHTPPRKKAAKKFIASQDNRENYGVRKLSLEEEALNSTQPSISLSQLEDAADNGSQLFCSQQSFASSVISGGSHRRGSATSLISLCTAAEKQMQEDKGHAKRKYHRKLPTRTDSMDSFYPYPHPPTKKFKTDGKVYSNNEPMAGEIAWLGYASKQSDVVEQSVTARRAAALAQRIVQGENDLAKRLLLSMALNRDSPRQPPSQWPPKGPVPEGFVWAHYPPLEALLKENMEEYYNLSMAKCQSSKQQLFNNDLVDRMREKANEYEWVFPTDRRTLRDRIRCYFKTHLQNAKKRLRTLLRNPTKRANAKNLVKLIDIIPDKSIVADLTVGLPASEPEKAVITPAEKGASADQDENTLMAAKTEDAILCF